MCVRFGQRLSVALIGLLLLGAGAINPSVAQATINVSLTTNNGCIGNAGAAAFHPGDTLRVLFSVDQTSTATLTLDGGGGPLTLFLDETLQANVPYELDGTANSTLGTRTLTLTASTATDSGKATCSYVVAGAAATGPTVAITGLLDNGVSEPCASNVKGGDQVCVRFTTNQDGNATISVTKNGTTTVVASGAVTAARSPWRACVTAGSDAGTRTINVQVTNTNGIGSGTCTYTVPSTMAAAPTVTITGLLVNGASAACGATVHAGQQVCVLFTTNQSGNAAITVTQGGPTTLVASGPVDTTRTFQACTTAAGTGTATISVTVTNANGAGTASPACTYTVTP